MHARPVVGGVFIKMLSDEAIWRKWAAAGNGKAGPWAPLHLLPVLITVLPAGPKEHLNWRYITVKPGADWNSPGFDDYAWQQGKTNAWIPKLDPKTDPKKAPKITDVWIRTRMTLPNQIPPDFEWILNGNADGELYINGIRGGTLSKHFDPEPQEIYPEAKTLLQPGGTIVIAAHIRDDNKKRATATANITMGGVMWP